MLIYSKILQPLKMSNTNADLNSLANILNKQISQIKQGICFIFVEFDHIYFLQRLIAKFSFCKKHKLHDIVPIST